MDTGFDFADLVDEAVERSGGERSTAADVMKIRRGLRLLTERWTAQRFNTWRVRSLTLKAVGKTAAITLPERVDDVIEVNSVRNGSSESPMERITADQYAQLAVKNTGGQPSQFWLSREAEAPVLHIYPIGPAPIVVWYVERPAEFDRYGGDANDVPGRWLEALVTGLALDLARKRPPFDNALIARLKAEAMEAEKIAQDNDRDRSPYIYRTAGRGRG